MTFKEMLQCVTKKDLLDGLAIIGILAAIYFIAYGISYLMYI